MRLIFLRHGKAIERGEMPDSERYLTDKGIELLEENLPYMGEYLGDEKVFIWSSPLKRAQETAKILKKFISDYDYSEHDFIATGKIDFLIEELKKLESKSVVVVVGHEPSLSVWTFKLTGENLDMKKGSVVELEFNKNNPNNGKFLHYKKIKDLKELIEP